MFASKFNNSLKVYPLTVIDTDKPYQQHHGQLVVDFVNNYFNIDNIQPLTLSGPCNYEEQDFCRYAAIRKAYYDYGILSCFDGVTKNPPKEVSDSFRRKYDIERSMDDFNKSEIMFLKLNNGYKLTMFKPLINIDKKGVKQLYDHFNLTDSLFNLTRSCVAEQKIGDQPCGDCWWCKERLWGFEKI